MAASDLTHNFRKHHGAAFAPRIIHPITSPERMAALDAQLDEMRRSRAAKTAAYLIKYRARCYRTRPAQLEILYPGLSVADPRKMIAIGETLLRNEAAVVSRRIDLCQVVAANAKAVIVLGRWRRRFGAQLAEVA